MNSQPSHFRATRAQFSPLLRRMTLDAFARRGGAARLTSRSPRDGSLASGGLTSSVAISDRWWDPHLVDRLHAPLTRYHD